ncbi:hypothetical protein C7N43_20760 [Sphingobacteriales bacterium UPWRP_1]|nr:hypothetical protein B6N25_01665 [Sphingobacteriales bacterium TSM_CSS]PSJ75075.1 hypothetical protein C7N43_20760 [Sphingobacteriales bacterium UPWRP_1]
MTKIYPNMTNLPHFGTGKQADGIPVSACYRLAKLRKYASFHRGELLCIVLNAAAIITPI